MKVNPLWDAFRFVGPAQNGGGQQKRQQHDRKEREPDENEVFEVTDQRVGEAVESFGSEAQNQASGLQASMEGHGPSLRVLLKDGSGALIRQFTGSEFIELRDAVGKDGRSRGRILDRKL